MGHSPNRSGFAMPMTLMILVFLTVGAATAFARVQTEMRAGQNREIETDAFAYAQSGLERFTIDRYNLGFTTNPPANWESTRIAMSGGYADVILRRVRPKVGANLAMYLVKSRGVRQAGSTAWTPRSEAVVSQYTYFREGKLDVLSAWTSLSGLQKNGGAGTIDGTDFCGVEPPVAGVAVPDSPGYMQSGGASVPTGSPPVDSLGTQAQTNAAVKIDWDGIVNSNALPADITIPGDPWPASFPANYWPVIRVNGNFTLPTNAQGTLIVTGNFTINGSTTWDGILLIGGTIYANGNNNVHGAVISGLNMKLGIAVGTSDVGNGTKTYVYDSCAIANAVSKFAALVMIGKTWSNNWSTW
jgi:hypothetical protein